MNPSKCEICGEPMPDGEQMFRFHGYSGPCPRQLIYTIDVAPLEARIAELEERANKTALEDGAMAGRLLDLNEELEGTQKYREWSVAQLDADRITIEELETKLRQLHLRIASLEADNKQLEEKVRECRNVTLEEAAKVAENHYSKPNLSVFSIDQEIRRLKEPPCLSQE